MTTEPTGKAKGGAARAQSLTPEERSEIAKKAADARWQADNITHQGKITLAGIEIPCYVTESGVRLLSGRGMQDALKLMDDSVVEKSGSRLTRLLNNKTLNPFIFNGKSLGHLEPIKGRFQGIAINGYKTDALIDICDAVIEANEKGALKTERLKIIAAQCMALLRSFARVGLNALVDEATGYQYIREKDALQALLDQYLRKELAAWAKRFPDEFYDEIFRLKKWPRSIGSMSKPSVIGHYTNDIVYERLAPSILLELQQRNPKDERGYRKGKHHQFLTDEVGHPALAQHLHLVIQLMKGSPCWDTFILNLDRFAGKKGQTMPLILD